MKKIISVLIVCCCLTIVAAPAALAADQPVAKSVSGEALLNVNSADALKLTELPGIGEVTAARIVTYRDENGPFQSVDEMIKIKGIGPKVLAKIRPLITI